MSLINMHVFFSVNSISFIFVKHERDVKKVAAYYVLCILHLMVNADKQSTTIHEDIAVHIDNIVVNFMSICDERSLGFIMRNCNEAAKKEYERLTKHYKKYMKFMGKI